MNATGWVLMLASWVTIISLLVFCLSKVFASERNGD